MRTIPSTLKMGLAASALMMAVGCGAGNNAGEPFDLSRLPIASEQDDQTSGKFVWVRPSESAVNCIKAPCPSYMLQEVNTGVTELAYAYDWRALKLPVDQEVKLSDKPSQLLMRGRYAVIFIDDQPLKVFQVTRANQRVGSSSSDAPMTDRYYAVRAATQSCELQPCPPLSALLLNTQIDKTEQWSGVDLSQLGLGQDQQVVIADIQRGDGYVSTHNPSEMPVVASAAFHQFVTTAVPQQ